MDLKKYISRNFIIRFCLLLAMVASAAVFDMHHQVDPKQNGNTRKSPVSSETEANKVFVCNQVTSFNLKTLGTDFSVRLRFACTHDKFLLKYYNLRTFQMMKAETSHSSFPTVCSFHSLPFNRVLYPNPDDTPPLS